MSKNTPAPAAAAPAETPLDRLNKAQSAKLSGLIRVYAADVVNAYKDSKNELAKALYDGALKGLQDCHKSNRGLSSIDLKDTLANYVVYQLAEQHREAIGADALKPAAAAPADVIDFAAVGSPKAEQAAAQEPQLSLDAVANLTPTV